MKTSVRCSNIALFRHRFDRPAVRGAALVQLKRVVDVNASSAGSKDGPVPSSPGSTTAGTRLLRKTVRGTAVLLVISIAVDLFNTTLFALHPLFISLGFLGFMSEGVLLAQSFRSLDGQDRVKAIWKHACVQAAALASIAIGFGAIYFNKIMHIMGNLVNLPHTTGLAFENVPVALLPSQLHGHKQVFAPHPMVSQALPYRIASPLKVRLGKPHFTSTHGLLGGCVTLAALIVVFMGAGAFRRLGLLQKLPPSIQPAVKRAHTLAGAAVWFAALVNVLLGLRTPAAGPDLMLHYGQSALIVVLAVAQGALLQQPRPAQPAKQPDSGALA